MVVVFREGTTEMVQYMLGALGSLLRDVLYPAVHPLLQSTRHALRQDVPNLLNDIKALIWAPLERIQDLVWVLTLEAHGRHIQTPAVLQLWLTAATSNMSQPIAAELLAVLHHVADRVGLALRVVLEKRLGR